MNKYEVYISENAMQDLSYLTVFIHDTLKSPLTAKRYSNGIVKEILSLKKYAGSIQISNRKSIQKYGYNSRAITYKKYTIIYTINNDIVEVKRIVPGGTISGI